MYNVFTDFHHSGLLQSLILLFEGRLGGKVYRPIGMEWAEYGYWKVYDHPATQAQFLTLAQGYKPIDGTDPLNVIKKVEDGVYYCQDIDSGYYNKAITVDEFLKKNIDIIIASLPQHIEPFKRLCAIHKDKPKLIFQIGNAWSVEAGQAKNVMASALVSNVPSDTHFISYHQEFDTTIFHPNANVIVSNGIYSFINCFNMMEHFKQDWQLFETMEQVMPGWNFKSYGGQCRDGAAHGSKQLARKIREAGWIWHTKFGGDGYGHILFNSAASGKPLITKKSYYAGKLGEKLMIDGVTCINVDNLSPEQIKQKIEFYSEPMRYQTMCENVYANFKQQVDFEKEEISLRDFLEKLI